MSVSFRPRPVLHALGCTRLGCNHPRPSPDAPGVQSSPILKHHRATRVGQGCQFHGDFIQRIQGNELVPGRRKWSQ